jgi:hypothetical protein
MENKEYSQTPQNSTPQKYPDNQKEPLGKNQRAYIENVFGGAYFRKSEDGPMVKKRDDS